MLDFSALFSVERGNDESLRQYTTRRLVQIEAASTAALVTMPTTTLSEHNLNTLLNGSFELEDVARALNMLDLDTQEGIIKAVVKPEWRTPSRRLGDLGRDQQDDEEKEEFEEHSEEEDHCPHPNETLATSWITQIAEEGLSETEAMDSIVEMNEQRKRTAQELKKAARKDSGFFSSRKEARNRVNGSRHPRYRCADCDAHSRLQPSRKAAVRTCEFNRIIALDV